MYIGDFIKNVFSTNITNLVGTGILVCMGFFIIWQTLIKNPDSFDLDNSKKIDSFEALYLGIAMSLDAFCVGIGSSVIGFSSIIFPLFVASFQVIFLSIGKYIGNKLSSSAKIPDKVWNIISGIILILIGIFKILT